MRCLGLDVGSSSIKGAVLDLERRAVGAVVSEPFPAPVAGLPPAMIVTAGFDPLLDEGRAYAERLAHDGVTVEYLEFGSMIHGFLGMPGVLPQARRGLALAGQAVREALADAGT